MQPAGGSTVLMPDVLPVEEAQRVGACVIKHGRHGAHEDGSLIVCKLYHRAVV